MWDTFCVCVWVLMLAIGFVGCVLPYPGHAFILGGCVLFSSMLGQYPAWYVWVILALLAVAGFFADNVFALLGAKKFGGGKAAIWGTLIGVIIGALLVPPFGLIPGAFIGAFAGEIIVARKGIAESANAGLGAVLGYLAGVLAKFLLGLALVAVYAYNMWGGLV